MKAKNNLRLYFGDLTHDYVALANGSFPLGIGYVASALKAIFKDEIEIDLFKYPQDLDNALKENLPDVYLFSSYMWNQNLNLFYAKKIKALSPGALIIGGGPNISSDPEERKHFLKDNPYLDLFVLGEGEIPVCSIIRNYIDVGKCIAKLKDGEISSALTLLPDGSLKEGTIPPRIGTKRSSKETYTSKWSPLDDRFSVLGDVPSPYLVGIMDKFFDNKLFPVVETNRGCPFACSFCQRGEDYFNRTTMRPIDMIKEELDYIAYHMVKKSSGVFRVEMADSNFAMMKQDLEVCKHLRELQDKYTWPRIISCSTGKNQPERIIEAVATLIPDSLVISNAMQSTNLESLEAIKRENISLEKYKMVQDEVQRRGLRSKADLILGLPLETKESHFAAIYGLIDSGVQEFSCYQAMILKDTDLGSKATRVTHGFKTKWRLIPRGLGQYDGAQDQSIVPECEEVIITTNTLSFDEYIDANRFHLVDYIYHNSGIFDLIYAYLQHYNIIPSKFIEQIYLNSLKSDFPIKGVMDSFIEDRKGELFDSEESCVAFYSQPENLEKVKNGEIGGNLIFNYLAIALFEEWSLTIDSALKALRSLIPDCGDDLEYLAKILNARVVDISQTPLVKDISIEIGSKKIIDLISQTWNCVEQDSSGYLLLNMKLSDSFYEDLSHAKTIYPNNRVGRSLILAKNKTHTVIRELSNNKVASALV